VVRFLEHRKLALWLALIAGVLASPALFLGFYLDDWIGRYIYSDLEGAREFYRIWGGGYAAANGNPADNQLQMELGYAPWWTAPNLLVASLRPLSLVTHLLDARLWPDTPWLQHAHSIAWLVGLIVIATYVYRGILGLGCGGFAALLFTLDYTHGHEVGFICNRHALITAVFGLITLDAYRRARRHADRRASVLAPLFFVATLLSGEAGIAIAGYLFAYTLFVDAAPLRRRVLAFAPYVAILIVWRLAYNWLGYGARGSGLYIDPGREPLHFLAAFVERGPILALGQLLLPPPEFHAAFSADAARRVWSIAVLFSLAFAWAALPLLKRDKLARFWAAGFAFSLIPAASIDAHSRQLLLSSIGAFGLVAQLWTFYTNELRGAARSISAKLSWATVGSVVALHLTLSPLLLPFMTCSVTESGWLHRALDGLGDEIAGRDLIFVNVPDYFVTRLGQLRRRIEQRPLPRRWRALAFGPRRVVVKRLNERTMRLDYEGGILGLPILELYRDPRLRMAPGDRIELEGLSIVVREVTRDGRARGVDFTFDTPLEAPQFLFYAWQNGAITGFVPPAIGESRVVGGQS
jgi:hypothetical protein